jgi:hypothetical protein
MSQRLDELYFPWLYNQVADLDAKSPSETYWRLLKQLYDKEFLYLIDNDVNRAEDGKDLRREFVRDQGITNVDESWMRLGCSMLELLIGLSRRLSFEDEGEPRGWFWHLMENLDLEKFNDDWRLPEAEEVNIILDKVIWRTYSPKGHGGLFPLKRAPEDQREVELWYQLSTYLRARG